jgi:hypothetical protein
MSQNPVVVGWLTRRGGFIFLLRLTNELPIAITANPTAIRKIAAVVTPVRGDVLLNNIRNNNTDYDNECNSQWTIAAKLYAAAVVVFPPIAH